MKKLNNITNNIKCLSRYINIKDFLRYYEIVLFSITKLVKITTTFLKSLIDTLLAIASLKTLTSTLVSLAIYSKIIIITSTVLPYPSSIVVLSTEYLSFITDTYGSTLALIASIFTLFKDAVLEYKSNSNTVALQTDIIDKLCNSHTELLKHLDDERSRWLLTRTDLTSDLRVSEETNRKLSLQNSELLESVKTFKTTSKLDKGIQIVTVLGNITVIGIQVLNAYSGFQNSSSANDVKLLVSAVNALLSRLRAQHVHETAARREAESTTTLAPSAGLTGRSVDFDNEFE